jgi:hypothetical protein
MKPTPLQLAFVRRLVLAGAPLTLLEPERPGGDGQGPCLIIRITRPNAPLSFLPRQDRSAPALGRAARRKPVPASEVVP